MPRTRFSTAASVASRVFALTLLLTAVAAAGQEETVLYSFNGSDGASPYAGVIFDASGNLYGTADEGGGGSECYGLGCGLVFELIPLGDGSWTEKVLHNFNQVSTNGHQVAAKLIFDAAGNLYGTTTGGGGPTNCGTVFELMPQPNGAWSERIVHRFNDGHDGCVPFGGVVFDAAGNLYGTTEGGGAYGTGVVFELSPASGRPWMEKILQVFNNQGQNPMGGLIFDSVGNLYGTTALGRTRGVDDAGTVFELSPSPAAVGRKRFWPTSRLTITARKILKRVSLSFRLATFMALLTRADITTSEPYSSFRRTITETGLQGLFIASLPLGTVFGLRKA